MGYLRTDCIIHDVKICPVSYRTVRAVTTHKTDRRCSETGQPGYARVVKRMIYIQLLKWHRV